jgi:hypothetical protein
MKYTLSFFYGSKIPVTASGWRQESRPTSSFKEAPSRNPVEIIFALPTKYCRQPEVKQVPAAGPEAIS